MRASQFAFFDVDDTLISIKSMFDFFAFWCDRNGAPMLAQEFDERFRAARQANVPREELNRLYYRYLGGAALTDVREAGEDWFAARFHGPDAPFIPAPLARLRAHQRGGTGIVLVSGSMPPLLAPLARLLGVAHCLSAQLVVDAHGLLTGEIAAPQTIGAGKAVAIAAFLKRERGTASDCYGYGDDISDLALLEAVGHPVVVGRHGALFDIAATRNWEIIPGHA